MTPAHRAVLLVDDDPDILEIVTLLLGLHAVPVVTAHDGAEALALLGGPHDLGLVIVDLMMPKMDGTAFVRQLKGNPELAATPVVVMSGNRDTAATATKLGADAYLLKPIEIDDLTRVVARFVPFDEGTPGEPRSV